VHHKQDLPLVALAKQWATFTFVHTRQMHLPHPKKDPYHRFLYSAIDLFIAITDQLREKALKHLPLPPARIQRLYYGVPPAPVANDCQSLASDADDSVLVVGMFSRMDPKKGYHTLLEAAGRLKLQGHRIRYHLFGDVADKGYFKKLEQLVKTQGLANDVHFEGFRTRARALMSCMDLVVMPSLGETFGLTVVEAMRSGVAVVGSDGDGIAEIIEHNVTGLLFPTEDSDQLAECIAYLYDHPGERHRLAQAGRRDADRRFDEGQHFKQLTKLFYDYHPAPAAQSHR
jgi:glycosyltransferase involved in cell wall biosynthesis